MEVTLASILNLASLGGLAYLSSCLKKERLKLNELELAKVYSPTRLLNSLLKPEFLERLTKNADNPDEYTLKAFIEGYVDSNRPILSTIDSKTKLVHSLLFKDEIFSNYTISKRRDLSFSSDEAKEVRAPLLFWLRDPNRENSCLVHRNLAVDATSALEKIAESREFKHLNWFEKILVYFGLFIELASLVMKTQFVYKGVKIGWLKNEYGVLLGTALTVYGEVIYNLKDKSLRIDTPQYYLHDKSNIVKKVRENIYGIQGKMMLLLIPLILSWIYLAKKAINYYKKLRRKRLEKKFDKLWKVKSVKMKDDYRCVVCFEKPRNIIAKPCLHFSLCGECYNRLDKKICPICKKSVSDVVEVFFS